MQTEGCRRAVALRKIKAYPGQNVILKLEYYDRMIREFFHTTIIVCKAVKENNLCMVGCTNNGTIPISFAFLIFKFH